MQLISKLSLLLANNKNSAILIGNYIDEFNNASKSDKIKSISKEPVIKTSKKSVYLSAMVEYLCIKNRLKIPTWVNKSRYFLKYPVFYSRFEQLKATLILESPVPFRRRNLFISENGLMRI